MPNFFKFVFFTCFVSLEIIFLLKSFSLLSIFFTKLAVSFLLPKLACANLTAKISAVNLVNSGVVIYLLWSGILFSTAVTAVALADW